MNERQHRGEELAPVPGDLVESLRDFGYTLPSALADLIDNSLTAGASEIDVRIEATGDNPFIAVLDNGRGMDLPTLVEAMRMGTRGPLTVRSDQDLGRFGLGLKTASLSQGRRLTVITKTLGATPVLRQWDIEHVRRSGKWELLTDGSPLADELLSALATMTSGTAVVIEDLDRASFLNVPAGDVVQHFGRTLELVRRHLAMVFHRFIESGVTLRLGSTPLRPWDPFLKAQSSKLPAERLSLHGEALEVIPYVLPHHSHLTDEEHREAGGPNGWNAHQGFYLYRCKRLILAGSWLNLQLRKEEHYKLARIQVDLPNAMDAEWQLNVTKSRIAAPAALRDELARIARSVRTQAAAVYRFRGERQAPEHGPPQRFLWKRTETGGRTRYRIDRTHPLVQALLHGGCEHGELLRHTIALLEQTIPVATILQEPVKSLEGVELLDDTDAVEHLATLARHAVRFLVSAGKAPVEARNIVLRAEPFVRHSDAISALLATN